MDITLERILSLIPKKPNGKFQHGAIAEFARSIGLSGGQLVSDWMAGRTTSYRNYLYEIAAKYGVSVEWLRGETDEKKPTTEEGDGLSEEEKALIALYRLLTPEMKRVVTAQLLAAVQNQKGLDAPEEK